MERSSSLLDRSQPPEAEAPRDFHFPAFERLELANGLTVLAARHGRVPLISLSLLFPAGGHYQAPEEAGLASFTASLLEEGTQTKSSAEIAGFVDQLGANLSVEADWNVSEISIQLLSRHLDEGLRLVAELATCPTFPEQEVERVRQRRLADLLRRRDRPALLAQDRLAWGLYGGTVFGFPLKGTARHLSRLGRDAVAAYYRQHYRLKGATLLAVGDLDPQEVAEQARIVFGDHLPGDPPPLPEVIPRQRSGIEIHVVDRPGASQTELRLGQALVPRTHPDYPRLSVMNSIFGGKFTSRINLSLREHHGYTYGASSRLPNRLGPGPFLVAAAVETEATGAAAAEVLEQLRRLRREPVSEEELRDAKSYLLGSFPYTLQTLTGLAHRLETLSLLGFPDDYYDTFPQMLRSVDRSMVLEVAHKHLDPDRMVIVAVGPAQVLASQLAPLGPVRLVRGGEVTEDPNDA